MSKKTSNEAKKIELNKFSVSSIRFRVVKNRLGGYSVEKEGKLLQSIFTLKKDAISHMNNLKKVEEAIIKKFELKQI